MCPNANKSAIRTSTLHQNARKKLVGEGEEPSPSIFFSSLLGLEKTATPLQARIVKVADAYDAMTSDRPYRRGMTHSEAVARLEDASASEFDTSIVAAFVSSGVQAELQPDDARSLRNLDTALRIEGAEVIPIEESRR